MKNPYEVLGTTSAASEAEIRSEYKKKAAMFSDNPEMMKEIDEAYDTIIMNSRFSSSGASGRSAYANSDLSDIREKLNSGRIDDAEMLLDGIPIDRRNAEWYYLKGTIQQRRGWLESAYESFEKAYKMDPSNQEYQIAYNSVRRNRNGEYRAENQQENSKGGCCNDPCNICSALLCSDCCCECMGGDLIRCC